jgi:hypothetical protein
MKKFILVVFAIVFSFSAFSQQKIDAQFPKATIAGKSAGDITLEEITKAGELQTTIYELTIVGFTLSYSKGNGDLVSMVSTTNKFTENMIILLKDLKKGQKFILEDIKVVSPDGKKFNLETSKFVIK